ncbi:hypothetical protein GQ54DRAFT_262277 [Martensiomyces pterosporus]|nr:hypothetical protein GQ54DRAFT_262277 [Martensiomyces pterosporus]
MADQPAPLLPGASSGFAGVPPPPPPPPLPANLEAMLEILNKNKLASRLMPPGPGEERGQKRPGPSPAHAGEDEDEDEDEEQQFRMLEESAKRVKLDSGDAAAPPLEQPASVPAATHDARLADTATATTGPPQTAADAEMEEEIRAALHSGPFELPPAEDMTPETCSVQIQQALERVVAGSKAIRRLIETKNMQSLDVSSRGMLSPAQHQEHQLQQHRDITESGVRKVLPNGQSTNAGILEDSMLMLVRLISNCYILCSGADQAYDARPAMGPDSSWSRIHSCVESVLDYILEAPRTHYGLAQLLLYEMWLAVVIADPEMKQVPEQAGSEYSALSLYLNWCQRIFGRIVECSAEHTTGGPLASGGVLAGGSSGAGVPLPQQHQQKQGDRLMLDFIIDVPYLAPQLLRKLQGYLSDPRTALAGIATLKDAIALRPPLLKEGLEILLTYSAHPQKETRTACILAVKKYYINSPFSSLIEKLAKTAIKSGVADAASRTKELEASVAAAAAAEGGASKQQQAEGESGSDAQHDPRAEILAMRKNGEAEIEAHLVSHAELFLALCTRNMDLFSEIFDIFVASPPLVQAIIQRIIKPLVRSTARTPAKFIPALERFPKGAENFALRVIILLTLDVAPSPELVQTVLNLFDQRGLGAQFLVVVANGMEKDEIQKRLPAVLGLLDGTEAQRGLVRECFSRLMRPYGGRPSRLSPTQLLIMLHDDLGVGAERTMEAIQVCVDMDKVFTPQILAAALKMMVEMPDVPPLVMRTAELCHRRNRSITGLIIGLLSNLVARKVWEMNGVFEGFAKCCLSLVPATLSLMLSMPAEPLKQMVSMEPSLTAHLHEYVQKMPESKRERFKWLIGASG